MADPETLNKDLMFLVLQFLAEEGYVESVHRFEQESGVFFNMRYFENKVLGGEWSDVETYLSGFTRIDENMYSTRIYFEIRKQNYLEALDRQDKKAANVLINGLKVFELLNEDLYKQLTQLITLSNFRENETLSEYGDTITARKRTMIELKKLLEANPVFCDKFTFPDISSRRITSLINQSLNWQHYLCRHPSPNPNIKSLVIDHVCHSTNVNLALAPPTSLLSPTPVLDPALDSDSAMAETISDV